MTSLLRQVYVCLHNNFFMTSFSLTSLNVVLAAMMLTQSVQYTAGQRTIGVNLLWQVFFVDGTDGQVFTLPIFSMTSALVEKLAC